jgi:hypothetical protein
VAGDIDIAAFSDTGVAAVGAYQPQMQEQSADSLEFFKHDDGLDDGPLDDLLDDID